MGIRAFTLLSLAAGFATVAAFSPADSAAVAMLREIAKKVHANSEGMPNYTCTQNIRRVQYAQRPNSRAQTCAAMAEDRTPGMKIYQDRLRLDVAVVDNRETFAWAGAKSFETTEISTLIEGTSGSGDFGSFLSAAFGGGVGKYVYKGEADLDIGFLAKFIYEIPAEKSRYQLRIGKGYATIGYRGAFYADPKDADIRRLEIEAEEFPAAAGVCRVHDTMDYRRIKMGDHDFLLPEKTSMEVLYTSGGMSLNETVYTGCKQYVGESTIRFDDPEEEKITAEEKKEAQIPLPLKTKIQVTLSAAVDLYRASAGDAITALVTKDVVKDKKVLVKANSKLHGRLVRLEQDFPGPMPHWVVGIKFESIERAGIEQAIKLEPTDDGFRSKLPATYARVRDQIAALPRHKKGAGMGLFIFATAENPKLDQNFRSEWQVSELVLPAVVPDAPAKAAPPTPATPKP